MLDQVIVAHTLSARGVHQHAHGLQLVVTRKDHRFRCDLATLVIALLVNLQMDEPGQQIEQAVAGEHLVPQIRRAVGATRGVRGISRAPVVALVKRQKMSCVAGEPRGHQHAFGIHCEMDQGATLEFKDRLTRIAILFVLSPCIVDGLTRERVFKFERGNRNAIHAQGDIERLFRLGREMELTG